MRSIYVLGGLAWITITLTTAGAINHLAATAVNQPKSSSLDATLVNEDSAPPLEKLVDVGGFRLHINCTGAGSPTVVLDAGLGVPSPTWSLVQPQVAKFTRVCSYDRAGIGKSDPGSIPRTSQQIATELHSLLNNAGIKGPYVMVGHSFGGLNVRLYTSQFPNEVVGMVLVDSSHEEQPPVDLAYDAKSLRWINFCRSLAQSQIKASTKYPQGAYSQQQAALYRDCSGSNGELAAFKESQAQARATQDSFGDMPLVVLTHGLPPSSWWSAHEELARRSSKGTHIVAERSGHFIQKDQPDLVSDAIYKVVEAARQK